MSGQDGIRDGEIVAEGLPEPGDAALVFIGRIRTPWTERSDCPRQGDREAGPLCRIEIVSPWERALEGLEAHENVEVFYWLHRSRRDLLVQRRKDGIPRGTFSLRSPVRPNPIGTSVARLVGIEGNVVLVRGLDCLDGTPLIDLKPDRRR